MLVPRRCLSPGLQFDGLAQLCELFPHPRLTGNMQEKQGTLSKNGQKNVVLKEHRKYRYENEHIEATAKHICSWKIVI